MCARPTRPCPAPPPPPHRSLQLQEQIRQLTEKKYELQQEEERSKQSPEDQREQLMAKIKRDNNESEQITMQVRDMQEQIKRMEARIAAMNGNSPAINAAEEAAKRWVRWRARCCGVVCVWCGV